MKLIIALLATAAAVPALAASNIVTNGSFETGNFSGWTQFGDTGFTGVAGYFLTNPSDGSYQSYFGPVGSTGGIVQSLSTVAGGTYEISFDMRADAGGQLFEASFGSATLLSGSFSSGVGYTTYNYTVQATGASTDLRFATQHLPSYYQLDNVIVSSVASVPEPGTWAMLIAGFGMVGFASRRRTTAVAA